MMQPANIFENATIRPDGTLPGEDRLIILFIVETGGQSLWFEAALEYPNQVPWVRTDRFGVYPNRNDAWVRINRFGLVDRNSARSRGSVGMRSFTRQEASEAKAMLERYFSGDARSAEKYGGVCLFHDQRAYMGVTFAPDWIMTGPRSNLLRFFGRQ